jgi:hypothetical protein
MESHDESTYLTVKESGSKVLLAQDKGFATTDLELIRLDLRSKKISSPLDLRYSSIEMINIIFNDTPCCIG